MNILNIFFNIYFQDNYNAGIGQILVENAMSDRILWLQHRFLFLKKIFQTSYFATMIFGKYTQQNSICS